MGLGMIIGVSAGGLVVLVAIAILITCLVHKKKKKGAAAKRAQSAQGADPNGLEMGQSYGNPMGDGKKEQRLSYAPTSKRPVSLAQTNVSGLPRGWSAMADPASGQMYYFNAESGETQWEVPRGDSLRLSAKLPNSNF